MHKVYLVLVVECFFTKSVALNVFKHIKRKGCNIHVKAADVNFADKLERQMVYSKKCKKPT